MSGQKRRVGSDYYPVLCSVGERVEVRSSGGIPKWLFGEADWDKFQKLSEEGLTRVNIVDDVNAVNNQVTSAIMKADDCRHCGKEEDA